MTGKYYYTIKNFPNRKGKTTLIQGTAKVNGKNKAIYIVELPSDPQHLLYLLNLAGYFDFDKWKLLESKMRLIDDDKVFHKLLDKIDKDFNERKKYIEKCNRKKPKS